MKNNIKGITTFTENHSQQAEFIKEDDININNFDNESGTQ